MLQSDTENHEYLNTPLWNLITTWKSICDDYWVSVEIGISGFGWLFFVVM
jgi:hypothetical protein